jgi:hypothetical protein
MSASNNQPVQSAVPQTGSYIQRQLSVTINLGEGSFGDSGSTSVTISNSRILAAIVKNGPPAMSKAEITIFGVTPSIMAQISTLGAPLPAARKNTVSIQAGDIVNGMAEVFQGNIQNAWQQLDTQPDTSLQIISWVGTFNAAAPVAPISVNGTGDVATLMSGIANQMGRAFENNGVMVKLSHPYYAGTGLEQAQALARDANIEMFDDGITLAIWPKNSTRGGVIPLIEPASGLISYPKYQSNGIRFRTIFNPNLKFAGQVQINSQLTQASGLWYINALSYDLASQVPDGPWFCDCGAVRLPGQVAPGS